MEIIKVGYADVIFDDLGLGAGKLTISDNVNQMNFSYYWGSMGSSLKEFVADIDQHYFSKNLIGHSDQYVMDVKKTFTAVRKRIREEIPFYEEMEWQKELREELKKAQENCYSQDHFIHQMNSLPDKLWFGHIGHKFDRDSIKSRLNDALCEPWHLIETKESPATKYLQDLHKKLKTILKKSSNTHASTNSK